MEKIHLWFMVLCSSLIMALHVDDEIIGMGVSSLIVYTDNCPGNEDWKHEFIEYDERKKEMAIQITEWVKRDQANDISVTFTHKFSGTITYNTSSSTSVEVPLELMGAAFKATSKIEAGVSYSYAEERMETYSWIITPDEPGKFFCIGLNFESKKYNVKHYKQKFKLFGQGDYEYQSTSTVYIPIDKYLSKNYKFAVDGEVYESGETYEK